MKFARNHVQLLILRRMLLATSAMTIHCFAAPASASAQDQPSSATRNAPPANAQMAVNSAGAEVEILPPIYFRFTKPVVFIMLSRQTPSFPMITVPTVFSNRIVNDALLRPI